MSTDEITRASGAVERWIQSPLGRLQLVARAQGLVGLFFERHRRPRSFELCAARDAPDACAHLDDAQSQLEAFFAGERVEFDLALAPEGTELQRVVWRALREIPFGQTRSYAQLAAQLGRPRAARAVGSANARNPISIIVPCHRVVGASGALTGYAGGVEAKQWLLEHERRARAHALGSVARASTPRGTSSSSAIAMKAIEIAPKASPR